MKIVVQKFGGTSVAGLERMKQVKAKVEKKLKKGYKVVVVLSAMAGETDRLIGLANEFSQKPDPAEMDVLLTTGEQVSIALFFNAFKRCWNKGQVLAWIPDTHSY